MVLTCASERDRDPYLNAYLRSGAPRPRKRRLYTPQLVDRHALTDEAEEYARWEQDRPCDDCLAAFDRDPSTFAECTHPRTARAYDGADRDSEETAVEGEHDDGYRITFDDGRPTPYTLGRLESAFSPQAEGLAGSASTHSDHALERRRRGAFGVDDNEKLEEKLERASAERKREKGAGDVASAAMPKGDHEPVRSVSQSVQQLRDGMTSSSASGFTDSASVSAQYSAGSMYDAPRRMRLSPQHDAEERTHGRRGEPSRTGASRASTSLSVPDRLDGCGIGSGSQFGSDGSIQRTPSSKTYASGQGHEAEGSGGTMFHDAQEEQQIDVARAMAELAAATSAPAEPATASSSAEPFPAVDQRQANQLHTNVGQPANTDRTGSVGPPIDAPEEQQDDAVPKTADAAPQTEGASHQTTGASVPGPTEPFPAFSQRLANQLHINVGQAVNANRTGSIGPPGSDSGMSMVQGALQKALAEGTSTIE